MGPSPLGFATGVGQATSQVGLTGAPVLVKHAVTVAVRTSRGQYSGAAAASGASMAAAIMAERERTLELIFASLGVVSLQLGGGRTNEWTGRQDEGTSCTDPGGCWLQKRVW